MIRTLLIIFLCIAGPYCCLAQDISGKWKGFYTESNFRQYQKRFNVEIIFTPLASDLVKFTMNIYKGKVLDATAEGTGIYNKVFNYLLFSQVKLTRTQSDDDETEPCYLAFNLSYVQHGRETLTGICRGHTKGNSVCGEGKVYLQRFVSIAEKREIRAERKEKRLIRKSKRQAAKAARH